MKKKFVALLVISLILFMQLSSVAANTSDIQEEWEEVQKELEKLQEELKSTNAEKKNVIGQIALLDDQLARAERELQVLQNKLTKTEQFIEVTTDNLIAAEKDLEFKDGRMKTRVRSIYKHGVVSYFTVLFEAQSFADLLSRFSMMRRMVENDVGLIEEVAQQRAEIEEQKVELEQEKQELVVLKRAATKRRSEYESRTLARKNYLNQLDQDADSYKKAQQELEEMSKRLEEIIRQAQIGDVQGTGTFTWPTPGYMWVTSPFGPRTHPVFGTSSYHTGIDIGVPYGKNIVAADTGTVTHAGGLGGYGKTVIVDHGNGYSTLYAHNSTLLVKQGDVVVKGEPISKCGTTGWSTGPHLHFEIRKAGAPENPLNYVKKQ